MSDSDGDEKKSLPSWQQKTTTKEPTTTTPSQTEKPKTLDTPRHIIIEQAKKFLEDDTVRDATTDKKIEFLESKGLSNDEIQQLLGVSRNPDASKVEPVEQAETPIVQTAPSQVAEAPIVQTAPSQTADSPTAESASSQVAEPPKVQPAPSQAAVQTTRDIPPIITYPEFLTKPTHPAPLITARRLLTTLYLFGGLSALFYGTSKYLVTPMVESLTKSRHSLAETTQSNLDKLLDRLSGLVSEIPPTISNSSSKEQKDRVETESDGDPTELFSRDIGVQTSLPSSPAPSYPGTPGTSQGNVDSHVESLQRIWGCVEEVKNAAHSEERNATDLRLSIAVLRDYLDNLAYIPPAYSYNGFPSAVSGGKEEDEISKVKASIRGVKGVLLSARSFPGGRSK